MWLTIEDDDETDGGYRNFSDDDNDSITSEAIEDHGAGENGPAENLAENSAVNDGSDSAGENVTVENYAAENCGNEYLAAKNNDAAESYADQNRNDVADETYDENQAGENFTNKLAKNFKTFLKQEIHESKRSMRKKIDTAKLIREFFNSG